MRILNAKITWICAIILALQVHASAGVYFEDNFDDGSFDVPTDWAPGSGSGDLVLTITGGRVNIGSGIEGNATIPTAAASQSAWNGTPTGLGWEFSFSLEIPSTYHVTGLTDEDVNNHRFIRLDGGASGVLDVYLDDIVDGDAELRLFNNYTSFPTGTEDFTTITRDTTHQVTLTSTTATEVELRIDGDLIATQPIVAGALPNRITLGSSTASAAGEVYLDNISFAPFQPLDVVGFGVPGGQAVIRWTSVSGETYTVSGVAALDESWAPVATNLPATGPETTYTNAGALGSRGFSRVEQE